MSKPLFFSLTEDELDALVSGAIRRAEILDDAREPAAGAAWHEVMLYEERLAEITPATGIEGGIARRGAVHAALKAHNYSRAQDLVESYAADELAPASLKEALRAIVMEDDQAMAKCFPSAARRYSPREAQKLAGRFRKTGAFGLAA
jgi:hypothetical protein